MSDAGAAAVQHDSSTVAAGGGSLELSWAAATHEGLVRESNQDAFRTSSGVFLVCDGMGGHRGGERASRAAADIVLRAWDADAPPDVQSVVDSVGLANTELLREADGDSSLAGMGTTLVGLGVVLQGGRPMLLAVNVGDSRLYVRASGTVRQVSHDHSVVQELIDAGQITPEESRTHVERHVVTRVLGSDPWPEPDVWLLAPTPGTRYLLCTDGVHGELTADDLTAALAQPQPSDAVASLVAAALTAGGRDNLTAVVVDVGEVLLGNLEPLDDDTTPRSELPEVSSNGVPDEDVVESVPGFARESAEPVVEPEPLIEEVPGA